jgi:peptidyl-prolyl cis-trans isomerase D
VTISRADPQALPRQVVEAVLRADAAKLPQWLGVDLGAAGYALARLAAVRPPAADAPQVTQLLPRYAQAFSAAEAQAYYKALERRFKVSIEPAALAAEAAASAAAN